MTLAVLHHDEDVDVFERLGLGVPLVRTGEKVAIDLERALQLIADDLAATDRVTLLPVGDLQPRLELPECVGDVHHDAAFQYASPAPSDPPPMVVPVECRRMPAVDLNVVSPQPGTSGEPGATEHT